MTGILKIDLPDDFEKGDCENCTFWCGTLRTGEVLCMSTTKSIRNPKENCPLEIQGMCNTCKNIATLACEDCSAGKTNYYEKSVRTIDLIKKNNQ